MPEHTIHSKLPSGFAYANALQADEYTGRDGFINGARKVVLVEAHDPETGEVIGTDLAVRLGPPKSWSNVISPLGRREGDPIAIAGDLLTALGHYILEYNRGWDAGVRENVREWQDGTSSAAFDDGYLDRAAGRIKWHLTYCVDHDNCGEG